MVGAVQFGTNISDRGGYSTEDLPNIYCNKSHMYLTMVRQRSSPLDCSYDSENNCSLSRLLGRVWSSSSEEPQET